MLYLSDKMQKAINIAIKVHALDQAQFRKGTIVPYISHPLTVAMLLSRVGATEDVIIAGILHDVVEDCTSKAPVTFTSLKKMFGDKVAGLVKQLTNLDKNKYSWEERKKAKEDQIRRMSKDALLIKGADMLHNVKDQIVNFDIDGPKMFDAFNANAQKQLDKNIRYTKVLTEAWPQNPFLPEISECVLYMKSHWLL